VLPHLIRGSQNLFLVILQRSADVTPLMPRNVSMQNAWFRQNTAQQFVQARHGNNELWTYNHSPACAALTALLRQASSVVKARKYLISPYLWQPESACAVLAGGTGQ
jgi:hypothetical protein